MMPSLIKLEESYPKMIKTARNRLCNLSDLNWFETCLRLHIPLAALFVYAFLSVGLAVMEYSSESVNRESLLGSVRIPYLWNICGLACSSVGFVFLVALQCSSVSRLAYLWAAVSTFIFCSAVAVAMAIMMASLWAVFCHAFIILPLYFYGIMIALNFITRIHSKTEWNLRASNISNRVPTLKFVMLEATNTTVGSVGMFPGMHFLANLDIFKDIESEDEEDFDSTVDSV